MDPNIQRLWEFVCVWSLVFGVCRDKFSTSYIPFIRVFYFIIRNQNFIAKERKVQPHKG